MSTEPTASANDPKFSGLGRALLESKDGSKLTGPWVPGESQGTRATQGIFRVVLELP